MVDLTKPELTTKKTIGEFIQANKSKIIKGTLLVTAVAAGFLATKYLQLKGTDKVLELTTSIVEELPVDLEMLEGTVKEVI